MKQLISFKNRSKVTLLLGLCFSILFACKGPNKEIKSDNLAQVNAKLNHLKNWNNTSNLKAKDIVTLLDKNMFFTINKNNDEIFRKNPNIEQIHAYLALNDGLDSLIVYLIDSAKDNSTYSELNYDNLYKYSVFELDTNLFKLRWDADSIIPAHGSSNITPYTAWSRVGYWNKKDNRNNWVNYRYDNRHETCEGLNPIFSMFDIHVSDLDTLKDHFCFLAIDVDSIEYKGSLNGLYSDLIIVNVDTTTNPMQLLYNVEDLVKTIPPCKPIMHNYSVLQNILQ